MVTSVIVAEELVEWPEEFEHSLRQAVTEAFEASMPVGLELAGILYGRRAGNVLRLSAWRAIPAEVRSQPALPMSPEEAALYTELVSDYLSDIELRTLQPVGWFRSRTRGMASLSPEDARACATLFGDQVSLALILRPSTQRPMTAAFFHVQDETENEASRRGVEVRWLASKALAGSFAPAIGLAPASTSAEESSAEETAPAPAVGLDQPVAIPLKKPRRGLSPVWQRIAIGAIAAMALVATTVSAYLIMDRPLRLDAAVREGKLLVTWNPNAGLMSAATGAELMIGKEPFEMTLQQLRTGAAEMPVPESGPIRLQVRGPYAAEQREVVTVVRPADFVSR